MNIRDVRQEEASEAWLKSSRKSMINSCPRFGKIRTAIKIMQKANYNDILCSLPRLDIKNSWENEFQEMNFHPNIIYTTNISAKKFKDWKGDLFIYDEPHESSIKQVKSVSKIVDNNNTLLLDGTVTRKTENKLLEHLKTDICYKYSIEQGVEEGILADYEIRIHLVDLDNNKKYISSTKALVTEKQKFKGLLWVRNKMKEEKKPYFFLDLKLISLAQGSIAKKEYTKKLLNEYKNERVLVFCGLASVADDLGIPAYHSKSNEKQLFKDFCEGIGEKLATIKMMESGITVKPIHTGVLNYTSGNPETTAQKICRFLGIEYNNPTKKAYLDIICSTEEFEKERIKTALMFFDENKIQWKTI